MTQILTAEQIEKMSVEEINAVVRDALKYNDYTYQKENGILITEKNRAEGMHKILYQCPHCGTEHKMASSGAEIFCTECGKRWLLREDGELEAREGETEFPHVPDWFRWEREQVRAQIERGEYRFEDEVDVYSMPRCWKFEPLGKAKFTHDPENGFVIEGHYRGEDYRIQRAPLQTNSLHVEYDFPHIKPFDCVDISTETDSFYCFPTKENVITKLGFATEIIYLNELAKKRK
jgi:DNA-directed RNA polymerase subunit RPC12/RpoP